MLADRRRIEGIFCASSEEATRMTDDEFWEAVYASTHYFDDWEEDYDPDHEALDDFLTGEKCSVCGAVGACGWDAEGLPLIHPKLDLISEGLLP